MIFLIMLGQFNVSFALLEMPTVKFKTFKKQLRNMLMVN